MTISYLKSALAVAAAVLLYGCSAPGNEDWPTVSFGDDIAAINAALEEPSEVALAPLPTLLAKDTAGLDTPGAYVSTIESNYRETVTSMAARLEDYNKARQGMPGATDPAFRDFWLTAQMELSNISQYTEAFPKMRAKLSALAEPRPERARVLLAEIEAWELQSRRFLKKERRTLEALEPK